MRMSSSIVAGLIAGAVMHVTPLAQPTSIRAQFITTPNVFGQPQFGSTTRAPNGDTFNTTPNVYGQPQFGSTTRGPNGVTCNTTPNVYGQPQFGSTTTCR